MIEIKNVSKSFDKKEVLKNINLQVQDCSVLALVGINGAGKSTLLRIICDVLRPDEGAVLIDGENVFNNAAAKSKIFFLSDDPYVNFGLTGKELAKFYSIFYDFDNSTFEKYLSKFALNASKPLKNFSKGMRRQLFIAEALACRPKYLLLDEAFDGLDPLARLEFKRGLIDLQEKGATMIISSHSLRELQDICDSFALIDGKQIKAHGEIDKELENICKLQLVFDKETTREELPFACMHFSKTGRVLQIVVKGDKSEILQKVNSLHPLVVDEIPMDFEDLFMYEVENKGYIEL